LVHPEIEDQFGERERFVAGADDVFTKEKCVLRKEKFKKKEF
jgi:hypothetical protein